MNKQFKFTDKQITSLPSNSRNSKSTESEYSDTQVAGLKCLVGKSGNKRFFFRYTYQGKSRV